MILRAVWYQTTVATMSWDIKQILKEYLEKSGDIAGLPFKLHDFGARGVSSAESAELGGAAHLVNFLGTDTIQAISFLMEMYSANLTEIGFSIPASEHSTITSWGRDREVEAYRNMVSQFGKKDAILAVVSDSYDIYNACKLWGTELKEEVINSGATVVIRPDSGDPHVVLPKMLAILEGTFGVTKNAKGYKVLNNVRIIWGDGIDPTSLKSILRTMVNYHGFSADNFAFGMGGGLLQKVDRDTQKFAMKASAARINGVWVDVFKDPITDKGKQSKKGRVTLYKDREGYFSGVQDWLKDELVEVYRDGVLLKDYTFAEVRANSNKPVVNAKVL
jgi:nicotinamide phosphoribosyltransferase